MAFFEVRRLLRAGPGWGRLTLALCSPVLLACGLPRDADGTLDRIRGGTMRVGIVVDTPWVTDSAGQAGGIEGSLVRDVAKSLGAHVEWVHGAESELLQTLEKRELDLVIGGLTASSPWAKQLAFTTPYYTDTILVGGPPNGPPPASYENVAVAVKRGDVTAATLRKKGAKPMPVDDLKTSTIAAAAPSWQLDQLHRQANPHLTLAQNLHVLAASPGENAWLMTVERMLIARRDDVPRLLRKSSE